MPNLGRMDLRTPVFGVAIMPSGEQTTVEARTQRMSPGDWIQEAIDLARNLHLVNKPVWRGFFDGDLLYSCEDRGSEYHLHMNVHRRTMSCNCDWYRHLKPCGHIGALILILRQIQESARPRNLNGQLRYEDLADYLDAS